ncbi:uncharacterized protein LOC120254986 [Dioscorea cayenensis subsp. rotundata]|uniref:Uncharacterized protein LOC120254986 n=1 Tax=Dioscorea cayennensis subsp. rotundata TaxID=55577 RepID=A0AB40AVN3_DIOCR|nr:uncharacterized protein LOC120254986 [Dioscorea cayenensis subsp. rotundata]
MGYTISFSQGVVEGVVEKKIVNRMMKNSRSYSRIRIDGDDKPRVVEFNEEKELYNPSLKVGMLFRDFEQLKKACRNWGINNKFQVWFPQNNKKRVICACHNKQCSFRIYAARMSKDNPLVQIKSVNFDHTCGKVFTNFHGTSKWLAIKYLDKFRADPNWSYNGIIKQVKDDHGFRISSMKAWRTKNLAMKWVNGDEAEQYTKLIRYAAELRQSNPGTTVILWRDEGVFKGFYVCLKPLKDAFRSVVLIENRESWTWFMEALRDDLEIWNSKYVTIMSDRQKGEIQRYILDARDKGIITMLEMIKVKLMRRMKKKKEQMLKYKGNICPKIQKKLNKMKEESLLHTRFFRFTGPRLLSLRPFVSAPGSGRDNWMLNAEFVHVFGAEFPADAEFV